MNGIENTHHTALVLEPRVAAIGTAAHQTEDVSMNSRFLTNSALGLVGGFAVVASFAWAPATFMWLMFAVGIAAVGLGSGIVLKERGNAQRSLDLAVAGLGAWTVVASLVFAGSVVTWLGFASGGALVALALIGLALHELRTERVVHSLEVSEHAPIHA